MSSAKLAVSRPIVTNGPWIGLLAKALVISQGLKIVPSYAVTLLQHSALDLVGPLP